LGVLYAVIVTSCGRLCVAGRFRGRRMWPRWRWVWAVGPCDRLGATLSPDVAKVALSVGGGLLSRCQFV